MKLAEFIHLFAFVNNDTAEPADVLLFIEGDGSSRPEIAVNLYQAGLAKKIVITGETKRSQELFKSRLPKIILAVSRAGVPREHVIVEDVSISTREQAVAFMKLAKENHWKSATLMAPLYHQPRVYATFNKPMKESKLKIRFVNHPVRELPWFSQSSHGTRLHLLKKELVKINRYSQKGHVASYQDVLAYQKWKEKNNQPNTNALALNEI